MTGKVTRGIKRAYRVKITEFNLERRLKIGRFGRHWVIETGETKSLEIVVTLIAHGKKK